MYKIVWTNQKVYDPDTIKERIKFIKKGIRGLMPLYGSEEKRLIDYAKKLKVPPEELFSIRSKIKTQKEIKASRFFDPNKKNIEIRFIELIESIESNNKQSHKLIIEFLRLTNAPIQKVIYFIRNLSDYQKLAINDQDYFQEISDRLRYREIEIRKSAQDFENELVDFLKVTYDIPFRTENEIKRDGDYTVTPDILFDEPVTLEVDGKSYTIRWLDAKNYILIDVPFIIKSLIQQAKKYNDIFGNGAFVFHYGFDRSVTIPGAINLDASFII